MTWRALERFGGRMRASGSRLADDIMSDVPDGIHHKDASHIMLS